MSGACTKSVVDNQASPRSGRYHPLRGLRPGDHNMIRRKIMAILIEEEKSLKITWRRRESLAWCKECGEQVKMITPHEAAEIIHVTPRAIYELIEREALHVPEFDGGRPAICLKSLLKNISSGTGEA